MNAFGIDTKDTTMDTTMGSATTAAPTGMGSAVLGQLDILTAARQEIDRQITQVAAALLGRYVRQRWPAAHAIAVGGGGDPVAVLDQAGQVLADNTALRGPDTGGGDVGDRLWELIGHLPPTTRGGAGGQGRILVLAAGSVPR
ncbi:valine--tRNA ligase [Prescottella subtropica]|uniref:valine--tRNA ligase n=1 Tax=Prescottella subtropica TaxID=2545757 RepID=UPI0010F8938E|nr:valine--tRNA ligase [Prescottella subtropica]